MEKKLCKSAFAGIVLSAALSLGAHAQQADTLAWHRTWYDAINLQWQSATGGGTPDVIGIDNWCPSFTFQLNHSNAFTDGKSLYAGYNPFCRYDMTGTFQEQFSIGGLSDVWKATYDGRYFYMIEWEKKGIFVVDPVSRTVVKVISTPDPGYLYYLCYVPSLDGGKGGFLTGNYTSMFFIDMRGRRIGDPVDLATAIGMNSVGQDVAVVGDKAYLLSNDNTHSRKVFEYALDNLKYTGKSFDLHDFVGQNGVEEVYYPRTILSYSYPDSRDYLMFVDYSGIQFNATSVLVDSIADRQGLEGYNLYRDGKRLNSEMLSPATCAYADHDLAQGQTYHYSLRPVVNGAETDAVEGDVTLADTRQLPLVEDFSGYDSPGFFPQSKLGKNYFTITNADSVAAWNIKDFGMGPMIQYYHGNDTTFNQCLQSRQLLATEGDSVKIELDYTGNTYLSGLDKELMNVEVKVDGTDEWATVGSVSYIADYGSYKHAVFDATPYVAGKGFLMRLRPSGAGESAPKEYAWQISGLKVWEYASADINGRLQLAGKPFSGKATVKAVLKGIGDEYTETTDEAGNFSFRGMHTGEYTITVSRDGESYTTDMSLDDAAKQYVVNIPAAVFTTQAAGVSAALGQNASKTYTVTIHNDGDLASVKHLSYRPTGDAAAHKGNYDVETEEEWGVEAVKTGNALNLYNDVLYYNGKRYQRGTSYSLAVLDELDDEGTVVKHDTLTLDKEDGTAVANFFVRGNQLYAYTNPSQWSTPPLPVYVMPVDLQDKKILNSKAEALDANLTSVQGMAYNENDSCLYASDYYNIYRLDAQGNIAETFELPSTSYRKLAFDNYSEGGPYVWMAGTNYSPAGYTLGKFSLKRKTFEKTFDINNLKESALNGVSSGYYSPTNCSLQASTDIVPGYYSLIVSQGYSTRFGQGGIQTLCLKLFPIEKWIKLVADNDTVDAQKDGAVTLTLNTEGMKDGETRQATVYVSAKNMAEDVAVPVSLTLDPTLNAAYPKAAPVTAHATDDNKVSVSWSTAAQSHAVDHYCVYRNGELLAQNKTTSYSDEAPLFGSQGYSIRTVYGDGVEVMSDTVYAKVDDPDWGAAVDELTATAKDDSVSLKWTPVSRYRHGLWNDFEKAEPFSIEPEEGWTFVDGDDSFTFSNTKIDYPNEGARMSAMYYSPALTEPCDSDLVSEFGNQMLTFTSSNVQQIKNDDWVITPELNYAGPMEADFKLRTRNPNYGKEKLVVEYSLTGNGLDCFTPAADTLVVTSDKWTVHRVSLPAGTKYVALHYASQYTYNLFVDNLYVGQSGQYSPVTGYRLYRDGDAVAELSDSTLSYVDKGVADGEHTYIVEAVYANGAKAQKAVDVKMSDTSGVESAAVHETVQYYDGKLTVSGGFDHLSVYTLGGSVVRQTGRHDAGYTLSVDMLPKGTYLVAVSKNGKTHTFKIAF